MPLFEYRCTKCEHVFEELQSASDTTKPTCPKCGSKKTERILSTFSPSVKGPAGSACDTGSCSSGACPTGTCPFA